MSHPTHRFPVNSAILFVGCLLAAPVASAAPPPFAQVLRFAAEGRADVTRLPLASGHNAQVSITALCRIVTPDASRPASPAWHASDGHTSDRSNAVVLKVIEIPSANRGGLRLRFETNDPMIRGSVQQAADFLARVVSPRWLPKSEIRVRARSHDETRAFATGLGGLASVHLQPSVLDVNTAIHELAHHIEGDHRLILEASKRFLARRARGGTPERLRDLTGNDYRADEIAYRANWTTRGGSHYSGKFYGPALKEATATESISMGLERLHREPAAFFREDSDYFLFLLLALQTG